MLTLGQVAMVARVRPTAVKFWRKRGWLTPAGERRHLTVEPHGTGYRYRLGDVLDAEADTSANPNCRRADVLAAVA